MARSFLLIYTAMIGGTLLLQLAFGGSLIALFARTPVRVEGDLALGLGVGLLAVLLWRLSTAMRWARRLEASFRRMLAGVGPQDAFALALLSALAEELFFRGFLQPHIGLMATAVLFGVVHVPQSRVQVPWTLLAIGMGVVLGALAEAQGGILAPTVAHFVVNYFNLHRLVGAPPAQGDP